MYLEQIISTFSTEDQRDFIQFLEKKNKRRDTKNIQLFKLIARQNNHSKNLFKKLYNSENKDAYHALRKRLYQSIIDFTANTNLKEENSIDIQIIKYILASRTFLTHKQYKVAYKILDKAEALAQEHHLFPILNEIYHTKIQYAYAHPSENTEVLIKKFKLNQKQCYLEDELNIVYAKIKETLHKVSYKGEIVDFETLLNQLFKEHNITVNDSMTFKSLYQLMTIVSISAFVTKDYLKIEPFLINTYHKLKDHKNKQKQQFYHIQVLYLIANTLFRNKKFKSSLKYLDIMHTEMQLKRKKYYNTFKLKYQLLQILNLNYLGKANEAIKIAEKYLVKKHPDIEALLDIYLSLIMIYFQQGELSKAKSLFSKFYHTDKWYTEKAGKEWTIKKNLMEILLHLELHHIDLFESRFLSFKRQYYPYLKSINEKRVITYLNLVQVYYKNPETITSKAFYDRVENSFEWIKAQQEDIFVMSFYAWLKSKMEQKPIYITTLNLIKKAQIAS